jgi:hypothetical protein
MDLKYDISNYIASVKMSSKKRILVEGRDDKSHINNLLDVLLVGHKIKIDTAEGIKGDCDRTAKNNRAKIEKIHEATKQSKSHANLFYLCDREFVKFNVDEKITDLMTEHESDGNLSWTIGHSLENYFITDDLVCKAYRFLCGSEYKNRAEDLYKKIFPSALRTIAAVTLAAKKIEKCTYPSGTIGWQDFVVDDDDEKIYIDIDKWKSGKNNVVATDFYREFLAYIPIVDGSDALICSRICRGHTAMLMLQRVFSACLFFVIKSEDESLAEKIAGDFSRIREGALASALSEAWIQSVRTGNAIYPENLIKSVA